MKIILSVLLAALTCLTYGQTNSEALKVYAGSIGHQSHLSNGTSFESLPVSEQEFPFYGSSEPEPGTVIFQGDRYENIFIQYNLVTDQLIAEVAAAKSEIQLVKSGIQKFTLLNHSFIQVKNHHNLPDGYYDLLFDENAKVLAKYEKNLQFKVWGNKLVHYYISKTKIYIEISDKVYTIRKKKDVLIAFTQQRDLIEKGLRQNKIRFKANPQQYCKEAALLYSTLNH